MAWWIQLILALAQSLPSVFAWLKDHPLGPKPAGVELRTLLQGLTKKE